MTTNRHCKLKDILLQTFKNKIKSYIKDDIHTLIVTFDVTNLHSNIAHKLGKQALSFWI